VSVIGAGLASIGIPKDSILQYDVALKSDNFLLIVHGTREAVMEAERIISGTGSLSYRIHGQTLLLGRA
jgi:hypothetical protein